MDNRETLTPSSGDAILKRHLFSEVARNWIKGRGHIGRAYFVRRPSRQSFGFRVAASSGPIPKAPGSAGGYLLGSRAASILETAEHPCDEIIRYARRWPDSAACATLESAPCSGRERRLHPSESSPQVAQHQ